MQINLYNLSCHLVANNHLKNIEVNKKDVTLKSTDLDHLSVKMIQSNTIPKVLPLDIEEINFNVSLHYSLGKKISLKEYISKRQISTQELYKLLYTLTEILENSTNFMLDVDKYSLVEDFIFIGENLDDIYLFYLPLGKIDGKDTLQVELRNLLYNLVGKVHNFNGVGFPELANFLNSADFSVKKLREMLGALQSNRMNYKPVETSHHAPQGSPGVQTDTVSHHANVPSQQQERKQETLKMPKVNKPVEKPKLKPQSSNQIVDNKKEVTQKTKIYTILAVAFLSALIWKFYLDHASEGFLLVSIGLTILVIDIAFIILAIVKPGIKFASDGVVSAYAEVSAASLQQSEPTVKAKNKKKRIVTKDSKVVSMEAEAKELNIQQPIRSIQPQNPDDYYRNLQNQTMVLGSKDTELENQTVLLSNEREIDTAYIDFNDKKFDRVIISKDHFTIGRNLSSVDYAVAAVGVSRIHFVITKMDDEFGIQDLNSSNGTSLNGQKLVPQKIYPIKDGDKILFGKTECTFKRGKL
jgi:pSer/pThr/pTyr-binding forkhead associated (FHA) protein/TM2 domain-containing membrane protein YozV